MKFLTAKEAREFVEKYRNDNIESIMNDIETLAKDGYNKLNVYSRLSENVLNTLIEFGYDIQNFENVITSHNGLYHVIIW